MTCATPWASPLPPCWPSEPQQRSCGRRRPASQTATVRGRRTCSSRRRRRRGSSGSSAAWPSSRLRRRCSASLSTPGASCAQRRWRGWSRPQVGDCGLPPGWMHLRLPALICMQCAAAHASQLQTHPAANALPLATARAAQLWRPAFSLLFWSCSCGLPTHLRRRGRRGRRQRHVHLAAGAPSRLRRAGRLSGARAGPTPCG